mmetsp:Transcript_16016/g.34378  ORF Transcript_16016/g.34378 Transcript_16016/m.34378 type:complete len:347 (+) Transcript_16016:329-1369(+)
MKGMEKTPSQGGAGSAEGCAPLRRRRDVFTLVHSLQILAHGARRNLQSTLVFAAEQKESLCVLSGCPHCCPIACCAKDNNPVFGDCKLVSIALHVNNVMRAQHHLCHGVLALDLDAVEHAHFNEVFLADRGHVVVAGKLEARNLFFCRNEALAVKVERAFSPAGNEWMVRLEVVREPVSTREPDSHLSGVDGAADDRREVVNARLAPPLVEDEVLWVRKHSRRVCAPAPQSVDLWRVPHQHEDPGAVERRPKRRDRVEALQAARRYASEQIAQDEVLLRVAPETVAFEQVVLKCLAEHRLQVVGLGGRVHGRVGRSDLAGAGEARADDQICQVHAEDAAQPVDKGI